MDSEESPNSCYEYNPNYGTMTLVFTLLPPIFTVSAFMRPDKASHMGLLFSILSGLVWVTLDSTGVWSGSQTSTIIGNFVFWQGWSLLGVSFLADRYSEVNDNWSAKFGLVIWCHDSLPNHWHSDAHKSDE